MFQVFAQRPRQGSPGPEGAIASSLIRAAGLAGSEHLLPASLSGGMRQRAALLRTLMEERPVILMDEPFSALDALTRLRLQNLAANMTAGATVVLVTHDPLEALRLGHRLVVLGGTPTRAVSEMDLLGLPPRAPDHSETMRGKIVLAVYSDTMEFGELGTDIDTKLSLIHTTIDKMKKKK